MSFSLTTLAESVEIALALAGAWLLWRCVLSPAARASHRGSNLAAWVAPVSEFLIFVVFLVGGTLVASAVGSLLGKQLALEADALKVFAGAASQLGMLVAVTLYWSQPGRVLSFPELGPTRIFLSGVVTFLICLPLLLVTAGIWEALLRAFNLPLEKQDLVRMFLNTESRWMLTLMISLAVLIAPVAEELVFRAGFFRFLRTRIPRWVAILAPAVFFASLHVEWDTLRGLSSFAPLVTLAVLFSLAYERTGHIGTSIVAHALFNLNTVAMIFCGVGVSAHAPAH